MINARLAVAVALTACALGPAVPAARPAVVGLYFEQQVATSVDQRPAGPLVSARVWWQGRRLRLEQRVAGGSATVLIARLDQERAFRLDLAQRSAQEIDLAAERAHTRLDLGVAGGRLGERPRVVRLRRARQIAGHACQGYRLRTKVGAVDVWLSRAIPADMGTFSDFIEWLGAKEALGSFYESLRQLPGFPLEMNSRLDISGRLVETRATVTRVRVVVSPDSVFEVPPEYRIEAVPDTER